MPRNIVICSDGTGNTFDRSVSNVTRLIKRLALDNPQTQIVVYDQGIGTNARRLESVKNYQDEEIQSRRSLIVLDGPKEWRFRPAGMITRILGLATGYGLKANVREMYCQLSQLYTGEDDRIFLFGFSRGAFTVRALAGLIYRCGLPRGNAANLEDCFERAWQLYVPLHPREEEIAAFRTEYDVSPHCAIHFLGVWDTVKSYGGILPILLPHLRHNPIVKTVRHALALDERRSWFNATTWGQLDLDDRGARHRLKTEDLRRYESQDIEEVWFRGCHSDIGGGDLEAVTASIPLRWMLREARAAGLVFNQSGEHEAITDDLPCPLEIHESLRGMWWLTEKIPRWEIDNSGKYPLRKFVWGSTGERRPGDLRRQGIVSLHTSVGMDYSIPEPVKRLPSKISPLPS